LLAPLLRFGQAMSLTSGPILLRRKRHHAAAPPAHFCTGGYTGIVFKGLRGEEAIAALCRKEGINQNLVESIPLITKRWLLDQSVRGTSVPGASALLTMRYFQWKGCLHFPSADARLSAAQDLAWSAVGQN
ncbi:MAG: hypothetical protein AAFV45_00005, partial [Pseudomonadota bacterium]